MNQRAHLAYNTPTTTTGQSRRRGWSEVSGALPWLRPWLQPKAQFCCVTTYDLLLRPDPACTHTHMHTHRINAAMQRITQTPVARRSPGREGILHAGAVRRTHIKTSKPWVNIQRLRKGKRLRPRPWPRPFGRRARLLDTGPTVVRLATDPASNLEPRALEARRANMSNG